jgi:hypothetical protein
VEVLIATLNENPQLTLKQMAEKLEAGYNVSVSHQTIA